MYLSLLMVQIVILLALISISKTTTHGISAVIAFRPINWIVLFYFLAFIMPQFFIYTSGMKVLGMENLSAYTTYNSVLYSQFLLVVGLVFFLLGFFLCGNIHYSVSKFELKKINLTRKNYLWVMFFLFIGMAAIIYLQLQETGGMRSQLVKSFSGKIAYGLSFFFTFSILFLVATFCISRKYLIALFFCLMVFCLLLPLGGRGRVLWPIVEAIICTLIFNKVFIKPIKLILLLAVVFIILQSLDPLFFILNGVDSDYAYNYFIQSLDISSLFMQRTFEGFHNFALIVHSDLIPHNISYILGGSGKAFMQEFFASEYASGVGFPATFFGELWISGGMVAIILGCFILGMIYNLFERVYFKNCTSMIFILCYLNAIPWLALIGGAYLDQMLKVTISIICSIIFMYFIKSDVRRNI